MCGGHAGRFIHAESGWGSGLPASVLKSLRLGLPAACGMRFADHRRRPCTMETLLHRSVLTLTLLVPITATAEPEPAPTANAAAAADGLDELVVVRVEIDGGSEIEGQLQIDTVAALREAAVKPDLPEDAPLEIVVAPDPDELGAYRVSIHHLGEPVHAWSCQCSGDELRAELGTNAVRAWSVVRRPPVVAAPEVEQEQQPAAPQEPEQAEPQQPKRGFGLWVAGMTLTGVGASLALGSSIVVVADATLGARTEVSTYGMLGASAALAVVGFPMWLVGRRRYRRTLASVGPAAHGQGLVFTVRGRF